jgi:serine phosphatase RsbU (regulator of sigma subunit)
VQVLFRSPDQSHEFRVYLTLTGRVTGYDFGKSTARNRNIMSDVAEITVHTNISGEIEADKAAKTPDDEEAEAIARRAMEKTGLTKLAPLGPAKVSWSEDDRQRREVAWELSPAAVKGLTLHATVSVRDRQAVAQHIEANVDKEHVPPKRKWPIFLGSLYASFLTFGAFYAMYRYAKRTLQKEVSHARTLLVAALFAVSYSVLAYSLVVDQVAVRVSGNMFSKIGILSYVTAGIAFALMGLLVGIGYGSGEGELREAYPGKVTSLDALLAGRILSRDVAASVLFGAAAAGWLLLGQHAIASFLRPDMVASRNDALVHAFARYPLLTLVAGRQYDALLIAVTGLLLPASFLVRRSMRKRRRFAWLVLFALLSVLGDAAKYPTAALAVLAMLVFTGALLLPFFAFDLLAAMVSLSALGFVNELVRMSEVVPSWAEFALWLASLTAVTLAVATYLALRGRPVREEDVRPLYAKNLAERMAMQAEILAAREAQLRLLPQAAPELPGVQLAACCLPARGVGGDFYDFFRLDATRLGIFVAQGGDQGLASALCIALAKGLLMHASQQSHSPTQIIVGLEASIAELLEGGSGSGISFAYGVMDTRRNLLNYARIGASPHLVIYRQGTATTASSQMERRVTEAGRLKSAAPIYEGAAHTHPGDFLIFVTEGLLSLRKRRLGRREYQWLEGLMRDLARPEEPLQTSLVSALTKYQNHASDDLTAVVLRMVESQTALQEVVA